MPAPGETREGYYQPLEKAEMVRSGGDVTILCYSRMRYVVMQAVAQLEKEGYDPEVRRLGGPVARNQSSITSCKAACGNRVAWQAA